MRISARGDYAVRAVLELSPGDDFTPADAIAAAQDIPAKFLGGILTALRKARIVESRRGPAGGCRLAIPPDEITLGDVLRAVEGPLVFVRDARPPEVDYPGSSSDLVPVWVALRVAVRQVLDTVTIADVASGKLPDHIAALLDEPGAWTNP